MKLHRSLAAALMLTASVIPAAHAAPVINNLDNLTTTTSTGTLTDETQVVEEVFTLTSAASLTAFTTSYGGGQNLDGTTATPGGFQSNLTLYNGSGGYLQSQTVTSPMAKTDSQTGQALDSFLQFNLAAGSYILTLTDWQNQQPPTATNLANGFAGPGGTAFLDEMQNNRTSAFALNLSASSTATPEPATFSLLLSPLAVVLLYGRKRGAKARINP